MKKIIITLIVLIAAFQSFGQNVIMQGNPSSMYIWQRLIGGDSALIINKSFADTSQANVSWLKNRAGVQIRTVNNNVYMRSECLCEWVQIGTGATVPQTIINYIDSSIAINNFYNGIDSSTRLISGNVLWDSGFVYENTDLVYQILGNVYTASADSFTSNGSDSTFDRYIIVKADTFGVVSVTEGAAANPADIPTVNPSKEILLAVYFIPALALQPNGLDTLVIYKENNPPTEWQGSGTATGLNLAYTINPFQGIYSTRVPALINNQYIEYSQPGQFSSESYSYLSFKLRLNSTFAATARLNFTWYNGTSAVSLPYTLLTGNDGYTRTVTGAYQTVSIPMSKFAFISTYFDKLRITLSGANAQGFQLDNIILQTGGNNITNNNTIDTTSLSNRINQKLNIIDTTDMRFRPIAGDNMTITGAYPNMTFNSQKAVAAVVSPIIADSISADTSLVYIDTDTLTFWRNKIDSSRLRGTTLREFFHGDSTTIGTVGGGSTYTAGTGLVLQGTQFKIQDTLNGAGSKLIWMPSKSAFRAGYVNSDQWDVDSIGNYSVAMGYNSKSIGTNSFSFHTGTARGDGSISIGDNAKSIGVSSLSFFGGQSIGDNSIAINSSIANNAYSTAIGIDNVSDGGLSTAIGIGLKAKPYNGFVIGSYNDSTNAADLNDYNTLNRVFQIGIGTDNVTRQNAMTVLFSGKTSLNKYGIGNFTGTAAYNLAVNSSGDIIEVSAGGSTPTLQQVITAGNLLTKQDTINLQNFDLYFIGDSSSRVYNQISAGYLGGGISTVLDKYSMLFSVNDLRTGVSHIPTLSLKSDSITLSVFRGITGTPTNHFGMKYDYSYMDKPLYFRNDLGTSIQIDGSTFTDAPFIRVANNFDNVGLQMQPNAILFSDSSGLLKQTFIVNGNTYDNQSSILYTPVNALDTLAVGVEVNGVTYKTDTLGIVRLGTISGGSSLFPTTGTGTAIGSVTGELAGNTFEIASAGSSYLNIIPSSFRSVLNATDGTGISFLNLTGDSGDPDVKFNLLTTNGANTVNILGNSTNNTITHTAANHVFDGKLNLLTLSNGSSTDSLLVTNNTEIKKIAASAIGGTRIVEVIIATANQTAFTFTTVPSSYADYTITVNSGATLEPNYDYTTSGNVVTMAARTVGDRIVYRRLH